MNTKIGNTYIENGTTEELVQLSFFSDIAKSIASCSSLNETLNQIMKQIGLVFAPLNWSLMLCDADTGDLKFTIVEGRASKSLKGKIIPKGQGIAGWIADNKIPLIIEDVKNDDRFDASFDDQTGFITESIIGAPLLSRGKVYGVIELINKPAGCLFTPFDLKLLTTITDFAAIAIEKVYYAASIKKLINIDPLTEVYNRRYFQFYLSKEIERTRRSKDKLSLLFIDIDDFKLVNDNHGHVVGDRVLKETASVLCHSARSSDLVFRYGGDEFIILLPSTASPEAHTLQDRITENLPKNPEVKKHNISLSIGIHEAHGENYEELLHFVDQKMYIQKLLKKERDIEDIGLNINSDLEKENEL